MENKWMRQNALRFVLNNWKSILPAVLSLILAIFIAVLPSFLTLTTIYLSIPLILAPSFVGFHIIIDRLEHKAGLPTSLVLNGFPHYYVGGYRGVYRMLVCVGKCFIAGIASFFLTSTLYMVIAMNVSQEFNETVQQIYQATDNATLYALLDAPVMMRFQVSSMLASMVTILILFMRHLGVHEMNVVFRGHTVATESTRSRNLVFTRFYHDCPSYYRKGLTFVSNISLLLLLFGFALGAVIGYFLFGFSMQMISSGILGAFILFAFYLPIYARYCNLLSYKYSCQIQEYSIDMAEREVTNIHAMRPLSEEEYKEFQEYLGQARAKLEEAKAEFDPNHYPLDK